MLARSSVKPRNKLWALQRIGVSGGRRKIARNKVHGGTRKTELPPTDQLCGAPGTGRHCGRYFRARSGDDAFAIASLLEVAGGKRAASPASTHLRTPASRGRPKTCLSSHLKGWTASRAELRKTRRAPKEEEEEGCLRSLGAVTGKKLPLLDQSGAKGLLGALPAGCHQLEGGAWGGGSRRGLLRVSLGSGWPQEPRWELNHFQGGASKNSECCPGGGPQRRQLRPDSASTQIPAPGMDPARFLLDPSPPKAPPPRLSATSSRSANRSKGAPRSPAERCP